MGFWQILSIPQPSLGKGQLWPWGRKSRARLGFSIAATRRSYGSSGWNGLRWKWCNFYWNFWAAFSRFIYLFFPCEAVYYESTEKYTGNVGTEVLKIVCIDNIFTLWCCFRNAQITLMVTKIFCDENSHIIIADMQEVTIGFAVWVLLNILPNTMLFLILALLLRCPLPLECEERCEVSSSDVHTLFCFSRTRNMDKKAGREFQESGEKEQESWQCQ